MKEFKIINDFVKDLINTFPEYIKIINEYINQEDSFEKLYKYCIQVFQKDFLIFYTKMMKYLQMIK